MPSLDEWRTYVAAHPGVGLKEPIHPERVADLTTKAEMVVAHPGWQMFLDRLASRRALLVARRTVLERAILDSDGTADPAMKLDLRTLKGEMAGLDFASAIIPDMIGEGEKYLKDLTTGESVASAQR